MCFLAEYHNLHFPHAACRKIIAAGRKIISEVNTASDSTSRFGGMCIVITFA